MEMSQKKRAPPSRAFLCLDIPCDSVAASHRSVQAEQAHGNWLIGHHEMCCPYGALAARRVSHLQAASFPDSHVLCLDYWAGRVAEYKWWLQELMRHHHVIPEVDQSAFVPSLCFFKPKTVHGQDPAVRIDTSR